MNRHRISVPTRDRRKPTVAGGVDPHGEVRPKRRSDCVGGPRPCPWVGCRYHLYLDVKPSTGLMTYTHGLIDLDLLPETCALDVADGAPRTLEEVGVVLNLTRERVRQIEIMALVCLRKRLALTAIDARP